MFEFLNNTGTTDALAGVHFALRRITHRRLFEDSESLGDKNIDSEDFSSDVRLGLRIIQEIESQEHQPLGKLDQATASNYKEKLALLAQALATRQTDPDQERGLRLLQEWRKDPLKNIATISVPRYFSTAEVTIIVVYLIIFTLGCGFGVYALWPREVLLTTADALTRHTVGWESSVHLFRGFIQVSVSPDVRLLLLVIFAGGLGSCVHATTTLADYLGNRRLAVNWLWWFLLRPIVGMVLAIIFYFVIRGGLISTSSTALNVNIFGITALSGLVGMFSQQAMNKLNVVFSALFASDFQSTRAKDLVDR